MMLEFQSVSGTNLRAALKKIDLLFTALKEKCDYNFVYEMCIQ